MFDGLSYTDSEDDSKMNEHGPSETATPESSDFSSSPDKKRSSSRLQSPASKKPGPEDPQPESSSNIPHCLRQYHRSSTSTRTFIYYGTSKTPKFASDVGDAGVYAFEGLQYCKKGETEYRTIVRYMEVSAKHKVLHFALIVLFSLVNIAVLGMQWE